MASNLGTVFVELNLDDKPYRQRLSETLTSTEATAKGIETSWRALGTKSDAVFDAQRRSYENAMTLIKNSTNSTLTDRIRAEEAAAAKINALNDQQFGKQTSMIETAKASYVGFAVAAVAAWALVNKAVSYMDEGAKALQIESSFKIMAESAGINAASLIGSMKAATRETVDDSDLMQKAVKLMLLDFDATQIEDFSKVAITASQYSGKTIGEAFDALGDAIANRSPKALRELGALAPEQMALFKEAVAAGATQTDVMAFALANLQLKQLQLKGTLDGATISLQQFHAQVKETGESVGKGLIVAVQKLYAEFQVVAAGALGLASNLYGLKAAVAGFMGDEAKAAAATATANNLWGARNDLMEKATVNMTGEVAAEAKATAESIAGGKAKVASALTVLGSYKDNTQAVKDNAAAAKKASAEIMADEKKRIEYVAAQEAAWIDQSEKENKELNEGLAKMRDEGTNEWVAKLKWGAEQNAKYDEQQIKDNKELKAAIVKDAAEVAKNALDLADKQLNAAKSMYSNMGKYGTEYYDAVKVILEKEATAREKILLEGVTDTQEADKIKKASAEKLSADLEKEEIKRLKASGDWKDGIIAYFKEANAEAKTSGEYMYDCMKTFADSSKTAISDTLFQAIKTGTVEIGTIWETFANTMLHKFTDTIAKMVVDGATKKITLAFGAVWTDAATTVLTAIGKILGYATDWYFGGDAGSMTTSGGGAQGGYGGHAQGGPVASGSPVWVGEKGAELLFPTGPGYVMPHGQSVAYAAQNGGYIPGYANGGLVGYKNEAIQAGADTPSLEAAVKAFMASPSYQDQILRNYIGLRLGTSPPQGGATADLKNWVLTAMGGFDTGLLQDAEDAINPYKIGGGASNIPGDYVTTWRDGTKQHFAVDASGMLSGTGGFWDALTGVMTGGGSWIASAVIPNSQTLGDYLDQPIGGSIYDTIHAFADPTGSVSGGTRTIGAAAPAWMNDVVAILGPAIGSIWGPGGAAAGAGIAADWRAGNQGVETDNQAAMMQAGMAAVATYMGGGGASSLSSAATGAAKAYAIKWLITEALGLLFPAENGQLAITSEGATGDLSWLQNGMSSIAPKDSSVSFPLVSARSGLDYVPRDNFRANLHEGEAVLNKSDAEDWRSGGGNEVLFQIAKSVAKTARILDRFDGDGMPGLRNVA